MTSPTDPLTQVSDESWQPFCGAEFMPHDSHGRLNPDAIAGDDPAITCDRDKHPDTEKHWNNELKFEWW